MNKVADQSINNEGNLNLSDGLDAAKKSTDCACCGASASISAYVQDKPTHPTKRAPLT